MLRWSVASFFFFFFFFSFSFFFCRWWSTDNFTCYVQCSIVIRLVSNISYDLVVPFFFFSLALRRVRENFRTRVDQITGLFFLSFFLFLFSFGNSLIVGDHVINLYNFFFVKMEIKESANQSAVLLGDRQPFFLSSKVSSRSERERERERGRGERKKKRKKKKEKK